MKRRGTSLIEMVVVISLVGTVLGSLGVSLHLMSAAQRRIGDERRMSADLERLAGQLRRDAHAADSASLRPKRGAGAHQLTFRRARESEELVYRIQDGRMERTIVRAGEVTHRETYGLPEGAAASWEIAGRSPALLVGLVWQRGEETRASKQVGDACGRIEAAVGLIPRAAGNADTGG